MTDVTAGSSTAGLVAGMVVSVGDLEIRVELEVEPGKVLALLGPNGAGKTTVLRTLAGLQPLDQGRVCLAGRTLEDSDRAVRIDPDRRGVGFVPQDHVLFPNLDVLDNVAFGPRARGLSTGSARSAASDWLERLGIGDLVAMAPTALSGGQSQRVALARALATEPALLLLDEPMAALDATTRSEVRRELHSHLGDYEGCTVVVTHDPVDALVLADRIAVMEHGSLTQTGSVAEVSARPRTAYVADLVGVNLLRGRGLGSAVRIAGSSEVLAVGDPLECRSESDVLAVIRPTAVSLHPERPRTSARNAWEFRVLSMDMLAGHVRVHLTGPFDLVAEVTPASVEELEIREGAAVWASVKATEVAAFLE